MPIRPFFINLKPEKGKLLESVGRKTIGLSPDPGYGCKAARQTQYL